MPRSLRPLRRSGPRTPDPLDAWAIEEPIPAEAMEHATIEELTCFPARPVAAGVGLRTLVAAAAGFLVLALGVGGRLASPGPGGATPARASAPVPPSASPHASPAPLLDLVEPRPGSVAWGGTVHVEAAAGAALGRVRIAILVGSAVLGATNVDIERPGRVSASIPVLAPPYPLAARVVVTSAGTDTDTGTDTGPAGPSTTPVPGLTTADARAAVLAERAISVRAQGPVVVWHAMIRVVGAQRALDLAGFAPATVDAIRVEMRTGDGVVVARAIVRPGGGREDTGSAGRLLGLARVDVHVPVPVGAAEPFIAVLTWRDRTDGTAGTALIPVSIEAAPPPAGRR